MPNQNQNSVDEAPAKRRGKASQGRSKLDLVRVPPHSVEAEQAVLGGVFLRQAVLHTLVDMLAPEDFYMPAHQHIFRAFIDLYQKNIPVDLITIAEYLRSHELLEQAGGAVYLAELSQAVVSGANAEHYGAIVRDRALLRGLIDACSGIIGNCFDPAREVDSLIDESEQAVFAISERTSRKTFHSTHELVGKVFEDLTKRMSEGTAVTGVSTGYAQMDRMTSGLQPTDLIIIAARPSVGKTAFALNLAMRAAVNQGTPVAVYSLEMGMEQLMMRMLCAWGKVDLSRMRRSSLSDDDWIALQNAADVLGRAPIYIDDTPAITTLELRARTRRLKAEHNVGMIMVDYLQLMRTSRRTDSRELEISDISRSLKALAKELKIPVVALSQLNRKVEERSDKRPQLSDLRESGAIEQDADVIMFIYRDDVYKPKDAPRDNTAEIIIGKQRNGPTGVVNLIYKPEFTLFADPDWRDAGDAPWGETK